MQRFAKLRICYNADGKNTITKQGCFDTYYKKHTLYGVDGVRHNHFNFWQTSTELGQTLLLYFIFAGMMQLSITP